MNATDAIVKALVAFPSSFDTKSAAPETFPLRYRKISL